MFLSSTPELKSYEYSPLVGNHHRELHGCTVAQFIRRNSPGGHNSLPAFEEDYGDLPSI